MGTCVPRRMFGFSPTIDGITLPHPLFRALIFFDLDADGRVDWGNFFFGASPRCTASGKEEVLGETGGERAIPKAILHT